MGHRDLLVTRTYLRQTPNARVCPREASAGRLSSRPDIGSDVARCRPQMRRPHLHHISECMTRFLRAMRRFASIGAPTAHAAGPFSDKAVFCPQRCFWPQHGLPAATQTESPEVGAYG